MPSMVKAICMELKLQAPHWENQVFSTIYFGGGTPSVLNSIQLLDIFEAIKANYKLNSELECTLEANPEDINDTMLKAWKKIGINRLSIGVQSLQNNELVFFNRKHTASQSKKCIQMAQQNGFNNISIDLIYGSYLKTHAIWETELNWAFNTGVTHISAYALTVEPKTALHKLIKLTPSINATDLHQAQQFSMLTTQSNINKWEHYEISNLAKPGFLAQHNSNYWNQIPYLGIGPSAHSYVQNKRSWNIANNTQYINQIMSNIIPSTSEELSQQNMVNEYIMTHLRLQTGISVTHIQTNFTNWLTKNSTYLNTCIQNNWITIQNNTIKLTPTGRLQADTISSQLFIV